MKKKQYIEYEDGTKILLDDDDVPELTDKFFKNAKSFSELPASLQKKLAKIQKRGRPVSDAPKQMIAFRFSPDLVNAIKAVGKGYNVRVEKVLRDAFNKGLI
ncbi:MAG: BrnA antitoxin family protein [Pseudomonadota bacterium]